MVQLDFWNDPKIVEEFTPEDKYFFLYLLTNPKTTQIGIYRILKKQIAFDTGYSIESVNAIMDRFINHHKIIAYSNESREIAIINWGKHNFRKGGKPVEDCVRSELEEVQDLSLIPYVSKHIENPKLKAIYDSFNVSYNDASVDTSSESINDTTDVSQHEENVKVSDDRLLDDTCTDSSTVSGQDKDKDEDKEEDKEQQQELINNKDSGGRDFNDPDFKEILDFYRDNLQKAITETPFNYELLGQFYDEWGKDLMLAALKLAAKKEAKGISFIEAVFNNWRIYGVKTLEDARRYNDQVLKQRKSYSNTKVEQTPDWYKQQKEERQKRENQIKQNNVDQKDAEKLLSDYLKKSKSG